MQKWIKKLPEQKQLYTKKDVFELPCEDNPCKDCNALSIIDFNNEVVSCIRDNPEMFSNYPTVGIMCHNRHVSTLKRYTCEELN